MKKTIVGIFLSATLFAQGYQGWSFNEFLNLLWQSGQSGNAEDQAIYEEFVADGAPCYSWIGGGHPTSVQPYCWYDPSNANPGWMPDRSDSKPKKR